MKVLPATHSRCCICRVRFNNRKLSFVVPSRVRMIALQQGYVIDRLNRVCQNHLDDGTPKSIPDVNVVRDT